MSDYSTLHNELRLRSPGKPSEFYDDAIRWAIDKICRKTSLWQVTSNLTTVVGQSIYPLVLPADTVIHSNLKLIQGNRTISPSTNGAMYSGANSDYIQSFKTSGSDSVEIFPIPVTSGQEFEVITAIKPISGAVQSDNDKIFDEYKDTVIYGALFRCGELDIPPNMQLIGFNELRFNNGISSIHVDVLKNNANTPMKISVGW